MNKPLDVTRFGVTGNQAFAVLVHSANQVIGDANIGLPPTHIGKNVDKAAHLGIMKYRALGSSPRVTAGSVEYSEESRLSEDHPYSDIWEGGNIGPANRTMLPACPTIFAMPGSIRRHSASC